MASAYNFPQTSNTKRRVRHSPNCLSSFSLRTRKVSPGKSWPTFCGWCRLFGMSKSQAWPQLFTLEII